MSPARSGTTAGSGGGPPTPSSSRSASTIVAGTASGYHLLKIDDYSRTRDLFPTSTALKSRAFTIGGHRWRIQYYPNGNTPNCGDYISLFLHLDEEVTREVYAQLQFRLLDDELGDKLPPPPPPPPSLDANKFFSHASWGLPKFIKKEELEKSRHLKGNSFTVRCDVVVITEFVAKDMPEATATAARRRTPAKGTGSFVSVPPSDLHRHLGELLLGEKGTDVVFKVGGKTFTAHRCVLAARSPVFGAELLGSMKESRRKAVVRVNDMEAQVFKALLRFVYTDSLPEMKEKDEGAMCQHLLVAADRYAMERLKLVCEEKLCERIDVSSVATVLALAEQHHCDGLRNACFDFLSSPENLKAAMAGDGFEHLSRSCPSLMTELVAMLGNLVQ
jgi:speckle-type POZ protein